ncbi:GntR family transcriptional regulator [Egibacter rhizosphaerae]|nr:GntR family transcriptional regulator [Egibacter rhizosphaerae]
MSTSRDQRADDLGTQLRTAILEGEFAPGERLVEAELSRRFDETRAAVRQALIQLDGEGLVERERNRGAKVRAISLDEAIEITEARAVLEGLAAAKAARSATDDERERLRELIAGMREAVEDSDIVRYSTLTHAVHDAVREMARQDTVAKLLERLRYESVRYHFGVALLPGRPQVGLREHDELVEAIVAGEAEQAEKIMREHLMSVIDALRQLSNEDSRRLLPGGRYS